MSANNPKPLNRSGYFDEAFDLRQYVRIVIKNWLLILVFALAPAMALAILSFLSPDDYTSEADLALLDVRSVLIFDPTFTTVPEERPAFTAGTNDRKDALLTLAESTSLALQVLTKIASQTSTSSFTLNELRTAMHADQTGDLLQLQVTWGDPQTAATIANAWAQTYAEIANRSYVNTISKTPAEARQTAQEAFTRYQAAQQSLETFIAANNLDNLKRKVGEMDALIAALQEQEATAIRQSRSLTAVTANHLAATTQNVLLSQMDASIERKAQDRIRQLDDRYARKAELERLQSQLQDLRQQMENRSVSAAAASGDALATLFTRSGLFRQEHMPELSLQLDLNQLAQNGSNVTPTDIDALLAIVQTGLTETNREIERLNEALFDGKGLEIPTAVPPRHALLETIEAQTQAVLQTKVQFDAGADGANQDPLGQALARLSQERQGLLAKVEQLEAQARELTRTRDTNWELYKTLDNKSREVEAQFATGAPQVRITLEALPPPEPDSHNTILYALAAAVFGGALGILFALAREHWRAPALPVRAQ